MRPLSLADISIDVVDLLKELTDSDNSDEDTSALLIDALVRSLLARLPAVPPPPASPLFFVRAAN